MPQQRFTYPFCYVPCPEIRDAADMLIAELDRLNAGGAEHPGGISRSAAESLSEGKMLGVLRTDQGFLYAFSGLVGGCAAVTGFVPPVFDYTDPEGHFRRREAEISAIKGDSPEERSVRAAMSAELQEWLFRQYVVLNGKGERASILDIFAMRGIVPPGGTGECAAPKLLNYAFANGFRPLAMGEFWYGASPLKEVRRQGCFYPSCTGKCGPLLTWMMQGLDVDQNPLDRGFSDGSEPEIIYSDDAVIIVSKPAGMLSVPGRTGAASLLEWLQERFGEVYSCHRLDMDTSGIMVYARTAEARTCLELQFAGREVTKTYRARLSAPGKVKSSRDLRKGAHGTIALPLGQDWYDRPRQMVDEDEGKPAVTEYEVLEVLPNGEVEVLFTPKTGRSHQLRVHAAHDRGLGRPIKGDRLYGDASGGRLWLHASSISFRHPVSGERLEFELPDSIVLP